MKEFLDNDGKKQSVFNPKTKKKLLNDEFNLLLDKYNLTKIILKNSPFFNPVDYFFRIGFIVENYEEFSKTDKENIDNFCKKYKLGKPTFYCGAPYHI